MTGKDQIVEELGDLLLPNLVNKGLVANDRAKYLLTLIQSAREQADHPHGGFSSLQPERTICGIEEAGLDTVVQRSSRQEDGLYRVPGIASVHQQILENLQVMLAPIALEPGGGQGRSAVYERRLEALSSRAPSLANDLIPGAYIDQITSAEPAAGDSLHLLVMNLHKELNRLQQQIAAESIDGASVYGVTDGDRGLIAAFMRGVNRTRPLKFDHPGLDTTATRTDGRLVIQNDIGTTDAHVLVIHVTPAQVAVTYTDVHIQRLIFFQNLLKRYAVHWEDTRSRHSPTLTESLYHLCVGRFDAGEQRQMADYLEFLGSRLVFLIDWNRARKRLRKLAPKRVCLEVLQWAADNDLGHMAFLKVGGEQLVLDAMQLSSRVPLQIGRQLSDIIGAERAAEFAKFTLKTASEGLLAGHSELLIRDQVRAELRQYLDTAHQGLLELAVEHATLIGELSLAARDCLLLPNDGSDPEYLPRMARRAKKWEHLADGLVTKARTSRGEWVESKAVSELLRIADDAADELEEGIFLLTLLEQQSADGSGLMAGESGEVLRELANKLVHTAQEYLKAVENARHIDRRSAREVIADFLEAIDHTISLEHQTDDVHRRAKASILRFSGDFKQLHLFTSVADNLEGAADAMMRAALMLRDYVLGEVITR
ncbi:MAG: hypothetical protein J5I93_02455 [Pirellulaceae bacterium]|nr:hypothetical protein [Pirellulaceae bacterium]